MANVKTAVKNVFGYTTPVGNRALAVRQLSWDNGNYVAATGLVVQRQTFGLRGIDTAWAGISVGKNYRVEAQLSGPAASQVAFRLFVYATGVEVVDGAALTADSVMIGVIGG